MIPNLTFLAGLIKVFFADTPIGNAATEVPIVRFRINFLLSTLEILSNLIINRQSMHEQIVILR
jgi:hypothetical protein